MACLASRQIVVVEQHQQVQKRRDYIRMRSIIPGRRSLRMGIALICTPLQEVHSSWRMISWLAFDQILAPA